MSGRPYNTPTTWNAERVARLRDLMARDLTYDEIGSFFGISRKAVEKARVKYGIPGRYKGWRPKRKRVKREPDVVQLPAPAKVPSVMESSIPWPSRAQMMGRRA